MGIRIGLGLSPVLSGGPAAPPTFATAATLTGSAGAGSYITTPDANDLDITGDLWVAAKIAPTDWTPAVRNVIISKEQTTVQRTFRFSLESTGRLQLMISTDGSATVSRTSTVNPTVSDGNPLWVAAQIDVDNGSSGSTTTFFTAASSDTLPTSWTELGTAVSGSPVLSFFVSTSRLEIGSRVANSAEWFAGGVYGVLLGSGTLAAGTRVAVFSNDGVSGGTYTDPYGHVWTVN